MLRPFWLVWVLLSVRLWTLQLSVLVLLSVLLSVLQLVLPSVLPSVLQSVLQSCNARLSSYFKAQPDLFIDAGDDPHNPAALHARAAK